MKRKQYLFLIAITVVAGLIGGAMSNLLFMARSAVAQNTKQHEKLVMAEGFRLVDKNGKERGCFIMNEGEPILKFLDESGQTRLALGLMSGDQLDQASYISLFEKKGRDNIMLFLDDEGPSIVITREHVRVAQFSSSTDLGTYFTLSSGSYQPGDAKVYIDHSVMMGIKPDKGPLLKLIKHGKVIWGSP